MLCISQLHYYAEGIPSGLSSPVEFTLSFAKGHSLHRSVILFNIVEIVAISRRRFRGYPNLIDE